MPSAAAPSKKLFVKSYGCQMNVYDAARMADVLAPEGYERPAMIEEADLIVLNTCHIREKAAEKVFSELGKVRLLKEAREAEGLRRRSPSPGCVAQAEGAEILRKQRAVDLVVGPQSYHRLPRNGAAGGDRSGRSTRIFRVEDKFDHLAQPAARKFGSAACRAFLTVQEGCDKFCSFCVVPYTRGAENVAAARKIVAEAERSGARRRARDHSARAKRQRLSRRGRGRRRLVARRLLAALARIEGIARLRYTTSHPNDMAEDLIRAHRELPALMPFLHLPVQSGSDRILDAMNRRHTADDYMRLVERIRAARPDIALSSDFIVGFPGETEADFRRRWRSSREVGFAIDLLFQIFARVPARRAPILPIRLPRRSRRSGWRGLQEVVEAQRHAFNASWSGARSRCCLKSRAAIPGRSPARSPYLQPVQVDGPENADRTSGAGRNHGMRHEFIVRPPRKEAGLDRLPRGRRFEHGRHGWRIGKAEQNVDGEIDGAVADASRTIAWPRWFSVNTTRTLPGSSAV